MADGLGTGGPSRTGPGEVEVEVTWNIMDEGRPNTDLFDLVEAGRCSCVTSPPAISATGCRS